MEYSANVVARIEARLAENKTGVKTYQTYEKAVKIGDSVGAEFAAQPFGIEDPVQYIVVFLPNVKRFTVVFMQSHWYSKHQESGYIGWFAHNGFFTI